MKNTIKLLEAIRNGYVNPTESDEKIFKGVIKSILRNMTDCKAVPYVSKKALAKAKEMGIDLSDKNWHDQTKFDKGRKIFHYEHCNTIKQLRLAILNTNESIEKILNRNITCWILKSENELLDKNGYKDKRPGGWKKCYKECGIEPVLNK